MGPLFLLSLLVLLLTLSLVTDRILGLPALAPSRLRPWLGGPLLGSGLILVLWSVHTFFRAKGTPVPFNPPPRVVREGPYSHSRNPMLTGLFLVLFGSGLILGSVSMVLFYTPLFILANVWELRWVEEPELEKRLGQEYVRYRSEVPMFFPRVKRREREKN